MTEDTKAVFVANISPNATEKTVSDFFSFCGRIIKLTLRKEVAGDGSQEAIVIFETDSAAKTALLLTNALIVDRPITVVPHVVSNTETAEVTIPQETTPEDITSRTFTAPDNERSKTSVIASMIAAGYVLGSETAAKAREIDDKHMISLQFKVGAEQVKAKANEIDKALHISETANVIKAVTMEKAKEVDEKLGISEKVGQAADAVKLQASAIGNKVSENEVVQKGVGMMLQLGNMIEASFHSLRDESMAIVEQKQRAQDQSGSPTATAVPTPSEAACDTPAESAPLLVVGQTVADAEAAAQDPLLGSP